MRFGKIAIELDGAPHVIDRTRQQRAVGLVSRPRHLVLPEAGIREPDVCRRISGVERYRPLEIRNRAWNARRIERFEPHAAFGKRLIRFEAARSR